MAPAGPPSPQSSPEGGPALTRGTEAKTDLGNFDLNGLLIQVLDRKCSDLHMTIGAPPTVRLNGALVPLEGYPELTASILQKLLYAIITQKQRERFEEELELDFAYSVPGRARFRVNLYRQREAIGAAFRLIPYEIKPLEALGVPAAVAKFASLARGFVLVTGPTGSGKSTTLASIVDLANRSRKDHIMTRSNSCISTVRAWSTSARWGRTRTPSLLRSSTCCARTPTSSWSEKCVTWRRFRSR
jgi:twitching motility protein PilT